MKNERRKKATDVAFLDVLQIQFLHLSL